MNVIIRGHLCFNLLHCSIFILIKFDMKFYCSWSSIENSFFDFMSVFFAQIHSLANIKNESERKSKYYYLTNKKIGVHIHKKLTLQIQKNKKHNMLCQVLSVYNES